MNSEMPLIPGAYARLLDEEIKELIQNSPEFAATLRKIDDEEEPAQYSLLLARLFEAALRQCAPHDRIDLLNRLVEIIGAREGLDYLLRRRLLATREMVTSVHLRGIAGNPWPLPETPLNASCLFTGSAGTPSLDHELRQEMRSADRVDFLVSFIKQSGLRLLMPTFEEIAARGVPVRVITTSYMGVSDPAAIARLVRCPHIQLKVSYDTEHTRLHAKAYHFFRKTGYSTAYIGSANLTGAAITSGLEWTVKLTEQDQPAVLQQFRGEFESYWENERFEICGEAELGRFRRAIGRARERVAHPGARFLAEITPRPFQERILEKLQAEREVHRSYQNLIVAATGTGKTVIAALDYLRFCSNVRPRPRLLFLAHRIEILEQARDCFRAVLRDFNFGEILGGAYSPSSTDHLFCTVAMASSRELTGAIAQDNYSYIVVDEAHHGTAPSYRPIYEHFRPRIWLGLTATPERMDGGSILPEYNHRIAAEIRLPEALEERLLCPFHYFGVTDPVSLDDDRFWRNGQYSADALTQVYTGDDIRAQQRVDALFAGLEQYQPIDDQTRAIGFCTTIRHAEYMKEQFVRRGFAAELLLGTTDDDDRSDIVRRFRDGEIKILFTVDVLNEGFDLPEINLVLFLRPTQSLTIFLQQLGRGLRHAPGKECLTVLDMVGQQHRKYRIDRKFAALLPRQRMRIDEEVEAEFPHLPAGCFIHLERVARENVLQQIKQTLHEFKARAIESLASFSARLGRVPTLAEFLADSELDSVELLHQDTWSGWKARARLAPPPSDPDRLKLQQAMLRMATRTGPTMLQDAGELVQSVVAEPQTTYSVSSEARACMVHYLLDGKPTAEPEPQQTLPQLLRRNPAYTADLAEIISWRKAVSDVAAVHSDLPFVCPLDLHAAYGFNEIKAAVGVANFRTSGSTGVGVIHVPRIRTYLHLVTFNKSEKDFSPSTRYQDYLLSRTKLHWQSMSNITQASFTGKQYIRFRELGYTILFFARVNRQESGLTSPFVYLGPAINLLNYDGNRPISMVWELATPVPAGMYEQAQMGG